MVKVLCLLLLGCACILAAPANDEFGGQPRDQRSSNVEADEMKKVMNMINSLKKNLFLANHGKRSAEEPEERDEVVSEEDLELYFNSAPTGFFFMPKPFGRSLWKRASDYRPNPNGFMFPTAGKRGSGEIFVRPNGFLFPRALKSLDFQPRNPNGFNFPMGKRGNPNGFNFPMSGKRGNPNGFNFPMGKRADYFDMDMDSDAGNFLGSRGKRSI